MARQFSNGGTGLIFRQIEEEEITSENVHKPRGSAVCRPIPNGIESKAGHLRESPRTA